MARNPLTLQTCVVPSDVVDEVSASGTGGGNGVEVSHSTAAPAIVMCINRSASPTTVTVPANGAKSKGILIPTHTLVVTAGTVAYFWLPPDYYASGGKLGLDVSASTDITFVAVKAGNFN